VGLSQAAAGRALTEHLLRSGRRRIAYAAAQLDPRVLQRAEGYRQALRAAGLYDPALELLSPAPSSIELGGLLLEQALARHPELDAIFFCNDDLAQGALLKALQLGVAVPSRLAVAGFNDLPGSPQMPPPLTTVRTRRREMGLAAAEMMLALIRGEAVGQPSIDLGFELVIRESA
jgi:LacI family gluconate utilization system Gnt-I transcriptional repressor